MTTHDEDMVDVEIPRRADGSLDYGVLADSMNEVQLRQLVRTLSDEVTLLRRKASVIDALGGYLDARAKIEAWKAEHPNERAPSDMVRDYVAASARFQEARRTSR